MKETLANILTSLIIGILTLSYFYGAYQLFTNKHYSSKQLIGGIIVPPYAIYVGGSEFFKEKNSSKECIDIEHEKTVEELLGSKNIKHLFDLGLSKDEIQDIATARRETNIKRNCR